MRRLCFLALMGTTIGCADGSPAPRRASPFDPGPPIPCQTDADCPALACGPCTPGEPFTRERATVDCKQDPCMDGGSVCGPQHVCVVRPGAKKRLTTPASGAK